MNMVTVLPIYGYGWMKGEASIEVPAPFGVVIARAETQGGVYKTVVGQCRDLDHEFAEFWVVFALRAIGSPPTYNVFLYDREPPFASEGTIDPLILPRIVTGFCTLDLQ